MNIQEEKLNLIQWISSVDNTTIIKKLKEIKTDYLKSENYKDDLKEAELQSIQRGLQDIKEGNVHSHDTVRQLYEFFCRCKAFSGGRNL